MTSTTTPDIVEACVQEGADAVHAKPLSKKEVQRLWQHVRAPSTGTDNSQEHSVRSLAFFFVRSMTFTLSSITVSFALVTLG